MNKQITGGSPALWTRFQEHLWLWWADDHDIAHLQYRPRQFQSTWFGVSQPSGCWVAASTRFQECLIHPWACPYGPNGQMTMTSHIYRPMWFRWTWFGVNQPTGCWVLVSAKFPGLLLCPWACPCSRNGQMTMMFHIYRPRWLQWTWSGVNWPSSYWVTASAKFAPDKAREHSMIPLFSFRKGRGQK